MQPYPPPFIKYAYKKYVLKDVWKTILDVIFTHIHKNINE